ncbi:hypothetical protein VII00023_08739 [Vibrio ichthyoenteri ATCC 700023]|uniref:Resolvase HTH domain-containing protein n=1 Tax=Vibrio ichthyoenteri ATCC 700023 TaxID=870968 RepID=F9S5P9_9VIBR|nr:hypothetical protein [Vibrio ichthyoenteri]EGU35578.1 hypothetical protein VII00023_08739 [Vibrio ichthyoenteri ATCC 700023]
MLEKKRAGRPAKHLDKAEEIKAAIDEGYTIRSIMKHFKVSQSVVDRIKKGTYQ